MKNVRKQRTKIAKITPHGTDVNEQIILSYLVCASFTHGKKERRIKKKKEKKIMLRL